MLGILLAVHVLFTMLLIMVILIQKSEGGSSLFASGAGNGMFTARGTSDILTKASWVLGACFLLNCILMAHISSKNIKASSSIINDPRLKSAVTPKQSANNKNKKVTNGTKKAISYSPKDSNKTRNRSTNSKSTPNIHASSHKSSSGHSSTPAKSVRTNSNNQNSSADSNTRQ